MSFRHNIVVGVVLSCATLPLISSSGEAGAGEAGRPRITVLFTPGDDCIEAIVKELDAATRSIHVQAYVLTSNKIGDALVKAKQRGVDVRVVFDAKLAGCLGSEAQNLLDNKVWVRVHGKHKRAHNKVILIDRSVVITGSFDFSEKGQTENADNLLIIKGYPYVAQRFERNWTAHVNHSLPYAATAKASGKKTTTDTEVAAQPTGKATVAGDQDLVYVTKHGKRYHRKDCHFVRAGAEAMTRAQAIKRGKTPCRVCRPE